MRQVTLWNKDCGRQTEVSSLGITVMMGMYDGLRHRVTGNADFNNAAARGSKDDAKMNGKTRPDAKERTHPVVDSHSKAVAQDRLDNSKKRKNWVYSK